LIRADAIKTVGLFDSDLNSAADWDYWIRLARKCNFALVPRYQILYRIWSQSMSYDIENTERNVLKVINRAFLAAPVKIQPLKSKSLSIANQYFTSLYLTQNPVPNWKKLASSRLKVYIRQYPKILLSKHDKMRFWSLILLSLMADQLFRKVVGVFS
jgi:hypothetical protein